MGVGGPAQCDVAATLHSLGNVYRGLGDADAAARCFAGSLRIREAVLGPTHQETARTRHCAALVGCSLGDESAALQELEVSCSRHVRMPSPCARWWLPKV